MIDQTFMPVTQLVRIIDDFLLTWLAQQKFKKVSHLTDNNKDSEDQ